MAKPVELVDLFWTNAGIMAGTGNISPIDFEVRVKSAAKAGFTGVALWHTDLEHILVGRSLREMKAILDDNGMKHLEVEFLADWFIGGVRRAESDLRKKMLFEASAALNASHVKVGDFYSTPATMPQLIDEFGALCREAEAFNARIGFEFMAPAMLPNLKGALEMVTGAGAKNGGVIVDIVHCIYNGVSFDEVAKVPVEYLVSVELNDGYPPGDPRARGSDRKFCGEGAFDVAGFIAAVRATGYSGPWGVEVFGRDLFNLPQDVLNKRAFETTMRFLA